MGAALQRLLRQRASCGTLRQRRSGGGAARGLQVRRRRMAGAVVLVGRRVRDPGENGRRRGPRDRYPFRVGAVAAGQCRGARCRHCDVDGGPQRRGGGTRPSRRPASPPIRWSPWRACSPTRSSSPAASSGCGAIPRWAITPIAFPASISSSAPGDIVGTGALRGRRQRRRVPRSRRIERRGMRGVSGARGLRLDGRADACTRAVFVRLL